MKKTIIFFLPIIFLISKIVVLSGCANIIPPSGGPRDSLPPVLIKSTPPDSTRNFTGNRITLSFDEYVDLQNQRENLIVSPVYKIFPDVSSRLNIVTIKLKDSLEPNTTYTINFGNALKDYNEGNVLKNFTYIFSTGSKIDSLELTGKVILAETGKIDSTLIVALYRDSADTAVIKQRPRYIARQNGKGEFTFKNLPAGTFYLYAFKDGGGSFRFTDTTQLFAFADKPVVTNNENAPFTLYAWAKKTETPSVIPSGIGIRKGIGGKSDKRLRFQSNLVDNKMDLLSPLTLSFDTPLRNFDSSKLHFSSDSTFTPINNSFFKEDSTEKKLALNFSWKPSTLYHLIIDKDFAEDTTGKKLLKTDTVSFTSKKIEDYGKLSIRFRNLDLTKNPVLIFVQNDDIKGSYPLSSATFSKDLFLPGDYDLRILEDLNKNGKWDPGEFFGKRLQPEIVRPVSRKITVKPDYENEFEIEAPSISSKGKG